MAIAAALVLGCGEGGAEGMGWRGVGGHGGVGDDGAVARGQQCWSMVRRCVERRHGEAGMVARAVEALRRGHAVKSVAREGTGAT